MRQIHGLLLIIGLKISQGKFIECFKSVHLFNKDTLSGTLIFYHYSLHEARIVDLNEYIFIEYFNILSDKSWLSKLAWQSFVDPSKIYGITWIWTISNTLINCIHSCLWFWHCWEEWESIWENNEEFTLSQCALTLYLFSMEFLKGNFSCVIQNKWSLNIIK